MSRGGRPAADTIGGMSGVRGVAIGLMLSAAVHERTELTLDLQLREGVTYDGEVGARLSDETHALLLKLGWQPPREEY